MKKLVIFFIICLLCSFYLSQCGLFDVFNIDANSDNDDSDDDKDKDDNNDDNKDSENNDNVNNNTSNTNANNSNDNNISDNNNDNDTSANNSNNQSNNVINGSLLGAWVYCDDNYEPEQQTYLYEDKNDNYIVKGFNRYAVREVGATKADGGTIDTLDNGTFYYTTFSEYERLSVCSWYSMTSDGVEITYSTGKNYFQIDFSTPQGLYYQYYFDQYTDTTALVYFKYTTNSTIVTTGPYYWKKISSYEKEFEINDVYEMELFWRLY